MNSWIGVVQPIATLIASIIIPIILYVITHHTNAATKHMDRVSNDLKDIGKKIDSHISWHLGEPK